MKYSIEVVTFTGSYGTYDILLSLHRLAIKVFKIDNRKVLGVALTSALVGSILMGDWQAIGRDPCSLDGNLQLNTSTNSTSGSDLIHGGSGSGLLAEELNSTSNSSLYVENCEALSSSSHQCFWNPESRVTGEFCNTCLLTCLSKQTTINFYQYTVGVLLISFASPLGLVLTSAITAGATPVHSQVLYIRYRATPDYKTYYLVFGILMYM